MLRTKISRVGANRRNILQGRDGIVGHLRTTVTPVLRLAAIIICFLCLDSARAQETQSFEDFRKGILSDYQNFRKNVLDDYAQFLDGVWKEYDAFRGVKRDPVPKPSTAPVAPEPDPEPAEKPDPQPQPEPVAKPDPKPDPESKPQPRPEPKPQPRPEPVVTPPVAMPMVPVAYKDIKVQLPKISPVRLGSLTPQNLASAWRETVNTKDLDKALSAFDAEVARMRLPDWWTMNLALSYGNALNPSDPNAASILAAIILVNRGLEVKIAKTDSEVAVLFRSDDIIYARPYFLFDDKKFYIAGDKEINSIMTYDVPVNSSALHSVEMRIKSAPVLPQRMKRFSVTDGHLTISGEVDGAMVERLRDYPQVDIPLYAASLLQPDLRASLRRQLREQTAGMSRRDAANAMISLVQHGFDYATDDDQFGFEKPFFLEELLYWPKCDCEDRSVMYSWMAREVLGIDAHLLHYPGHEATAIALGDDSRGHGYNYGGVRYTTADPTFIGAPVGMCMPQFEYTKPEIQIIK